MRSLHAPCSARSWKTETWPVLALQAFLQRSLQSILHEKRVSGLYRALMARLVGATHDQPAEIEPVSICCRHPLVAVVGNLRSQG